MNITPIRNQVEVVKGDVRDPDLVNEYVSEVDTVFHLAAQLSRTTSMEDPATDAEINCGGTLNVLNAAAACRNPPHVLFTSSQAVLGKPKELPMQPDTEPNPVDVYGANKLAAEQYLSMYNRVKEVPTTVFRLTNVYGPRAQLANPNYGVINRFLKQSLEGQTLSVFDPGDMSRDFVYVDDVVDALVTACNNDVVIGERYFVGTGIETTVKELAEYITDATGTGTVEFVPWPDDWDSIRVDDLYADYSKIHTHLGWEPTVGLQEGLNRTISYYLSNSDAYDVDPVSEAQV
jgi:UDP-glucose 4-epimerase